MKLKRLMALGMAAVMTMSLTACGGDDKAAGSSTATDNKPAADTSASADNNAAADNTGDTAADTSTAEDTDAAGGLTYAGITLGEDYTDLNTTIKFIHHKTDRE